MPRDITFFSGNVLPVATEEELLEFCNKVRQAGGANVLEALLPSVQQSSYSCLIANALNFGCSVSPYMNGIWLMRFPENISASQRKAISEATGLDVRPGVGKSWVMELPEHIGNAAKAFDWGLAFTEYVKEEPFNV